MQKLIIEFYNLQNCRVILFLNPKTKKYVTNAVAYKAAGVLHQRGVKICHR